MGKFLDFLRKIGVLKTGKAAADQLQTDSMLDNIDNSTEVDTD